MERLIKKTGQYLISKPASFCVKTNNNCKKKSHGTAVGIIALDLYFEYW